MKHISFLVFKLKEIVLARTLCLSQGTYVKKVLERFGMADCKAISTPLETGVKLTKSDCPTTDKQLAEMKESHINQQWELLCMLC